MVAYNNSTKYVRYLYLLQYSSYNFEILLEEYIMKLSLQKMRKVVNLGTT